MGPGEGNELAVGVQIRQRMRRGGGGNRAVHGHRILTRKKHCELRGHRSLDFREHQRRHLFERVAAAQMLSDLSQYGKAIVPLSEEPAVDGVEPPVPRHIRRNRRGAEEDVQHAPALYDGLHRLRPVPEQVDGEDGPEHGSHRDGHPPSHGVLEPLPDDEADVEQPVTKHRVGDGERGGEQCHGRECQRRRLEDRRLEVHAPGDPVERHQREAWQHGCGDSRHDDPEPPPLIQILYAPVVPDGDGNRGRDARQRQGKQGVGAWPCRTQDVAAVHHVPEIVEGTASVAAASAQAPAWT